MDSRWTPMQSSLIHDPTHSSRYTEQAVFLSGKFQDNGSEAISNTPGSSVHDTRFHSKLFFPKYCMFSI